MASSPSARGDGRSESPLVRRGVSLDWLVRWTSELELWNVPTHVVVKKLVVPATSKDKKPYCTLLSDVDTGRADIFLSHGWGNRFGLIVATARKFASKRKTKGSIFLWIDIFAVTQHPGEDQIFDLSQLEMVIEDTTTTLMVLDRNGLPLSRCWCLFELFVTIKCGAFGKLQIRVGELTDSYGGFSPISDPDLLRSLSSEIDLTRAEATLPQDKKMILSRIKELDKGHRSGIDEFVRKVKRCTRHGWS